MSATDRRVANVEMAAAWDGPEGAHWATHAERYEATASGYWQALLRRVPVAADARVVDIGCGTGHSTRELARLATSGAVLGVDLSAQMLERARAVTDDAGLTNVHFEQADAQIYPFAREHFDLATSSFGAMFFADPVAAFSNIARGLRPHGRIAVLVWRELAVNEWVRAIRDALAIGRDLPEPAPDVPGPFGLARREHAQRVLTAAGLVDLEFEGIDEPLRFGSDPDDAFAFVSTLGITRGLTHDLNERDAESAVAGLRGVLAEHYRADGVLFDGSAWLITARKRGKCT